MANLVNNWENKIADALVGAAQLTTPATVYLALFSADPTETGEVINELSGGGYARAALTGAFTPISGIAGKQENTAEITFATATANWPTVTHAAFCESGTQGTADLMVISPLDTPIIISNGEVFAYAIGKLVLTAA